MRQILLFSCMLLILTVSISSADSCFETRKQAFKDGFLSSQLSSRLLKTEFAKYQTNPELLLQYFRYLSQIQSEPFFVLKFKRELDPLGRLLIQPSLQIKTFAAEDFPNASYLSSLLEYNKDFSTFSVLATPRATVSSRHVRSTHAVVEKVSPTN